MSWIDRVKASKHGVLAHEPIEPELAINALRVQLFARFRVTKDDRYMILQQQLQELLNAQDPLFEMAKSAAPSRGR